VTILPTADIVVAGGGPAGAATALALRRSGASVVLLNRSFQRRSYQVGETLPPHSCVTLQRLGVWDSFCADGHMRCPGNSVSWGQHGSSENDFLFSPYGCGWHLDRVRFDAFLRKEAILAGVQVCNNARLLAANSEADGRVSVRAQVDDSCLTIRTAFVVDATGRAAAVLRRCGVKTRYLDNLVGLMAVFLLNAVSRTNSRTLVESVENGWWYSARIPGSRVVVALMTDMDVVQSLRQDALWATSLAQAPLTRERFESGMIHTPTQVVSARSSTADRFVGSWWAAVGDAATTWDPLSSQGITKALENGILLASAICDRLEGRGTAALDAYDRTVRAEFEEYLKNRSGYYSRETRWPDANFWRRRQTHLYPRRKR
jgi:2-polyprenyl-6-methoxyphenol hydroxylase-like FAD-dependent oxidoreductase